jgi:hypothetical protein
LSRYEKEQSIVGHLRMAPYKPTSGGKPLKKKRRSGASTRVAAAWRMAATSLRKSQRLLSPHLAKIGAEVAVFATARKLATLVLSLASLGQTLCG